MTVQTRARADRAQEEITPMLTGRTPVDSWPDLEHLPGTPWSMRAAAAPGGRAALEMYDAGILVDVMVARSLAPQILRGARSAVWAGQPCALAWGCLPADGTGLLVTFTRGRMRPQVRDIEVTSMAGCFWIALADGRFHSVAVTHLGTRARCRLRAVRPY